MFTNKEMLRTYRFLLISMCWEDKCRKNKTVSLQLQDVMLWTIAYSGKCNAISSLPVTKYRCLIFGATLSHSRLGFWGTYVSCICMQPWYISYLLVECSKFIILLLCLRLTTTLLKLEFLFKLTCHLHYETSALSFLFHFVRTAARQNPFHSIYRFRAVT